jgi:adenylylsulfate kinase-like enzyme
VYAKCPIDVLAERDVKGLYKKALRGEIKNFTGVDDPYEPPLHPDVIVESDMETPAESAARVIAKLEEIGYVRRLVEKPAVVTAQTQSMMQGAEST